MRPERHFYPRAVKIIDYLYSFIILVSENRHLLLQKQRGNSQTLCHTSQRYISIPNHGIYLFIYRKKDIFVSIYFFLAKKSWPNIL